MENRDASDEGDATEPVSLDQAMSIALRLHQSGQHADAYKIYARILQVEPSHPDALHFMGILAHQQGADSDAIRLIRHSVVLSPEHAGFRSNLGNLLLSTEQFEEAEREYVRALALDPQMPDVLNNYAVLCKALARYDESELSLLRVIELAPDFIDARNNLASLYMKLGRIQESVEQACEALVRDPAQAKARELLGVAYCKLGRLDDAAAVYRAWLAEEPGNPYPRHCLAACSGQAIPERASDEYLQQVFDQFADSFDAKLAKLEYRAPALIGATIETCLGKAASALDILDAGCGTGLCGPWLKGYARRLVGVDLSRGMLDKAKARGLYDDLLQDELTAYLAGCPQQYDLIVSADTLVYFGALEPVFVAAAEALRPGGHLCFTLEALQGKTDTDYQLQPHGRYAHHRFYLEGLLGASGLEILKFDEAGLRYEAGVLVQGWLVLARKPLRTAEVG